MFGQQIIQGGFRGLGSLSGFSETRLDQSDQALRGSVVDVVIYVGDANRVLFYDKALSRSLVDRLNSSGFRVISFDDSNIGGWSGSGGGTIRARVQIMSDGYNSVKDAASVVAGAASALGFNATGSTGVLVSTPQQTQAGTQPGQMQTGQTFDPSMVPSSSPAGVGGNAITDFIDNLTKSPTTLAVIAGAVVILVIAAKK